MSSVVEALLMFLVKQIITPDLIKAGEKALVEELKKLAADTSNKVDDAIVQIVADALGIQV